MNLPLVAIISDNDALALTLHNILSEAGFLALWCGDYQGAYQVLHTQQPDMVLIEARGGRLDLALLALNRIRLDPGMAALPLVLCMPPELLGQEARQWLSRAQCELLSTPVNEAQLRALLLRHLPPRERAVGG
jgi:CheY-like chemotaxis protein